FAGAADERAPDDVLVVARRLADEHDPALWIAVSKDKLRRCGAQRAAFEAARSAANSSSVCAVRAASRAAMSAVSGGGGATADFTAGCGISARGRICRFRSVVPVLLGDRSSAIRLTGTSATRLSTPASR